MSNAVAVMRVSSERQGFEGDSIEHQKDQIDLYASTRQITIKKYFIFIESASKEQQPVQEAIDYCKNKKNKIDLFIIKSIDRFTRGGSSLYDHMKTQLSKHNVRLVDLYGVIGNQKINTLEHLGVEYPWSVYNPSKKSELLEAERGKDELRDILSRMIGSEIRYVRLGYRVREAPLGYKNIKVETPHGKRIVLIPHPTESVWIKRMFALKKQELLTTSEIVEQINHMGFKTRRRYKRDKNNKNKIVGILGKVSLDLKLFYRILQNPIYTGIFVEKWTDNQPIKGQFKGLVSIDTFNKANEGKIMIFEEGGTLKILRGKNLVRKMVETERNAIYPYRRLILCPIGRHPYYGSASRGKGNGYFPAYHCDGKKRGHYSRIPVKKFHATVVVFLNAVRIKKQFIKKIYEALSQNKTVIKENVVSHEAIIKIRLLKVTNEMELLVEKIKVLHSEAAILPIEKELEKLDEEKKRLEKKEKELQLKMKRTKKVTQETPTNKLPESLINDHTMIPKKQLFDLLFAQQPTYDELVKKTALLNKEFEIS